MNKDTKMIRITSRGFVTTSRGRVMSPIMSPYRETISRIWGMITSDRATVEEQLPDKSFIKLTTQNFDKDNYVSKEKKVFEKPDMVPVNTSTFKNTDNDKSDEDGAAEQKQENNTNASEQHTVTPEVPVDNESKSENDKVPEDSMVSENNTDNDKSDEDGAAEQKQENNTNASEQHTVTINGEKRVDPRFNKKNNKKNHNNNSIAVNPESVQ